MCACVCIRVCLCVRLYMRACVEDNLQDKGDEPALTFCTNMARQADAFGNASRRAGRNAALPCSRIACYAGARVCTCCFFTV